MVFLFKIRRGKGCAAVKILSIVNQPIKPMTVMTKKTILQQGMLKSLTL